MDAASDGLVAEGGIGTASRGLAELVAQTTVGRDGITAYGLDGARLLEVMSQFQRRTDA
jgi:hypothetical protein